ncbi:MAG: NAD-dependent epimerase/dehydratase family protein [Bosea sp. (in: a-proteobacteria)]
MSVVIFGGSGFVGLNIAMWFLADRQDVTLFDRRPPLEAWLVHAKSLPGKLTFIDGDVMDADAVKAAVKPGTDLVVLGAAITAGPEREASDPASIISINLLAQITMLEAARDAGVRRVINLSSAAAYGRSGERLDVLDEDAAVDPVALYPITKWASERIGARICGLWGLGFVNLRLSGVFGPWEHLTGVRDTPSPQFQILKALEDGKTALLPRPGLRDWVHATDVAEAVAAVGKAETLPRNVYNISPGRIWSVLDFGQALARGIEGGECRLAVTGEVANIDLYGPGDRAPLSADAMARDVGWRARFGLEASVVDLMTYQQENRSKRD